VPPPERGHARGASFNPSVAAKLMARAVPRHAWPFAAILLMQIGDMVADALRVAVWKSTSELQTTCSPRSRPGRSRRASVSYVLSEKKYGIRIEKPVVILIRWRIPRSVERLVEGCCVVKHLKFRADKEGVGSELSHGWFEALLMVGVRNIADPKV